VKAPTNKVLISVPVARVTGFGKANPARSGAAWAPRFRPGAPSPAVGTRWRRELRDGTAVQHRDRVMFMTSPVAASGAHYCTCRWRAWQQVPRILSSAERRVKIWTEMEETGRDGTEVLPTGVVRDSFLHSLVLYGGQVGVREGYIH